MRLSFDNALPLGMESEDETLFIFLEKGLRPKEIMEKLSPQLPSGIDLIDCRLHKKSGSAPSKTRYTAKFKEVCVDQDRVDAFMAQDQFFVEDISKKGKIRKTDLRETVVSIAISDTPPSQSVDMVLKKVGERTIRPSEILIKALGLTDACIQAARIIKRR